MTYVVFDQDKPIEVFDVDKWEWPDPSDFSTDAYMYDSTTNEWWDISLPAFVKGSGGRVDWNPVLAKFVPHQYRAAALLF